MFNDEFCQGCKCKKFKLRLTKYLVNREVQLELIDEEV